MRGEHFRTLVLVVPDIGSSPRARGTQPTHHQPSPRARFIPACAGNTIDSPRLTRHDSVHPRVRGEHRSTITRRGTVRGSSPRARGTQRKGKRIVRFSRFIPACAGNTTAFDGGVGKAAVHPRVRGEHASRCSTTLMSAGSSPRARGTQLGKIAAPLRGRFIPACAGNTRPRNPGLRRGPVHPRVRGEHVRMLEPPHRSSGSSPRPRGTLLAIGADEPVARFIPACAGNTLLALPGILNTPVHPRVRGEHRRAPDHRRALPGSSPRARGTPGPAAMAATQRRFIPACAGNTNGAADTSTRMAVHPRVRGEHHPAGHGGMQAGGSSPRARGTLFSVLADIPSVRFIPACAGNTGWAGQDWDTATVHPRVRGEHSMALRISRSWRGSSPRARGTQRQDGHAGLLARFIPACAGNTCTVIQVSTDAPVHPRVRGEHSSCRRL